MKARHLLLSAMFSACLLAPVMSQDKSAKAPAAEPYPVSTELAVLEKDLTSGDYRAVLATMIPTDLEAEWQRIATVDNYLVFAESHGGPEKIATDPKLKAAYDRRRLAADQFLALIREAYKKRHNRGPFENQAVLERALRSAASRSAAKSAREQVPVRVVMPAEGAERQWPRLRGPDGQGTAVDSEIPLHWAAGENVAWKLALPGRGNSSPVVWDDRVYVTTASADGQQRKLLCVSRPDGRLLWEHEAPAPKAKESLYMKNSFASATPVTDGERVIVFFGNSGLVCFDREGHEQWHADLGVFRTMHGPGASPVLYKDRVICIQYQHSGSSLFAAYDKCTGRLLWKLDKENATCWSTPVVLRVGDQDQIVYNGSHAIAGYDPQNGKELWHVSGTSRESIPMVVVGGGLLFSASGRNGPTIAIRPGGHGDLTETNVAWRNLRGGPHVPSPLYHDGRLYLVNDTGIATCLDAADGRTVWQNRLRGRFSMSPIEARGRILVTSEEGRSSVLKAGDKFQVLAENDLGEPVLATPALLGGRLYFRTATHLLCVGQTSVAGR